MKSGAFIIVFFFPLIVWAQSEHTFFSPPSSKTRLIAVGDHTIYIEPLDNINKNQKWLTFDSALNIVAAKKLVTPNTENILEQTYLQTRNSVIRIDQSFREGHLYLSAFVFDVQGNIIHATDLLVKTGNKKQLLKKPFFIAQSPDKRSIVLVQPQVNIEDSLSVATIVFDDTLGIKTNAFFTLPFDNVVYEVYMPLINDDETVFIPVVDKFKSYKLSSDLKIISLERNSVVPEVTKFVFDRKKIQRLNFIAVGNTLLFSALFSNKNKKDEVAGILHSGYDVNIKQKKEVEEYIYTDEARHKLKKAFGSEGRKGNLFNYLTVLPAKNTNKLFNYAVLLPMQDDLKPHEVRKIPEANKDIELIKQDIGYAASLVGTQPAGYSRPMNVAEANTYAKKYDNTSRANNNYSYSSTRTSHGPGKRTGQESKNLLFYSLNEAEQTRDQFVKIRLLTDARYKFFTYYGTNTGYGALHYSQRGFKPPYLKATSITNEGAVDEKVIFDDKNKILVSGYDFIILDNTLIAFYHQKDTDAMGLIKIKF